MIWKFFKPVRWRIWLESTRAWARVSTRPTRAHGAIPALCLIETGFERFASVRKSETIRMYCVNHGVFKQGKWLARCSSLGALSSLRYFKAHGGKKRA